MHPLIQMLLSMGIMLFLGHLLLDPLMEQHPSWAFLCGVFGTGIMYVVIRVIDEYPSG